LEGIIISRPYIEMTARLMQTFGVQTFWNGQHIRIEPQNYQPIPFTVENDWSAASYWYEIIALAGDSSPCVVLSGLEKNSIQGDSKVAVLFEKLQTNPTILDYDFTNEPDLAQTLAVTCCLLNIPFRFTGLQSLRIKETDRISALQNELKKLGYVVKSSEANLVWSGERCEADPDPVISTYDDHRMAMAFAPVCLKTGKIRIEYPHVVSKSYPGFWKELEKAGFEIE
jgi:3-phosphoshikimate 1-carboxyvinyltransferase